MIPHSAPTVGEAEAAAAARVIHSGHLSQGREVAAFESECAAFVGRRFAVAVSSGTSALHLALAALELPAHSRVAVPAYACASLSTAVHLCGLVPSFMDIADGYNADIAHCPPDAGAVVVPHLFGLPARTPTARLWIEDIAQSIGGPTGQGGLLTVASFYATKLMTTGEGGMVLTDDLSLAEHVRDRRDYDNRDDFKTRYNYKMTDVQAAIGREQLRRLPGFVDRRRDVASRYHEAFAGLPVVCPGGEGHVYFRYVIATDRRAALQRHLTEAGVESKRPVHCPSHHYFGGQFPESDRAHERCLSLPIYPTLTAESRQRVVEAVRRFFE
ncbi:MAG: aminotransferase DegT [Candidatus Hydrogenedentota bacterium]